MLEALEDLQKEHNANFYKLALVLEDIQKELKEKHNINLPLTSFVKMANYFDEEKFKLLRKRILDKTNDLIRNESNI